MRWLPAVLLIAACTQPAPPHDEPQVASHVEVFEWPGLPPSALDVLIVLDDTAGIAPYADRTRALLAAIGHHWDDAGYATPDLHIALTTADPADAGALRGGGYVVDEHLPDGSRFRNYDGTLADTLVARGDVGTAGAAAQPFVTIPAALDATSDFLRARAPLAIVLVTAHDDGSTAVPEDVAHALKLRKDDPAQVVVLVVAPVPAPRIDTLLAQFPNRASSISIDALDYTPPLALLSNLVRVTLAARCLSEPVDVDPATPGPQYDCSVELVREDGVAELVPPCPAFAQPATSDGTHCWWYRRDLVNCTDVPGGALDVTPYHYPAEPTLRGQCLTAVTPSM